jgi:hypothetical protein
MECATMLASIAVPSLEWLGLAWYVWGSCPLEYRQAAYEELPGLLERSSRGTIALSLNSSGSTTTELFSVKSQPKSLLDVLLEPDEE